MPDGRPAIPAKLVRALMIEAGHRCAIPTCRAVAPLQIEHIDDFAQTRSHDFDNMIILCANCHGLKGSGPRKLDRLSLRQYKANLRLVNSRYGDVEHRVLDYFAFNPQADSLRLPVGLNFLLMYLLKDGLLEKAFGYDDIRVVDSNLLGEGIEQTLTESYLLTVAGREFVERWVNAVPLEKEVVFSDDDYPPADS